MVQIVNSLFADYLPRRQQEPVGVADPRQQTMLTNQMLTPVMNKPVMPSRDVPVFPSVGGIGGGYIPAQPPAPVSDQVLTRVMPKPTPPTEEAPVFPSVGGIGGGVVPTEPLAYDPSNINLGALDDIDVGGFDITDLGLFQEGGLADDVFSGLDITLSDNVNPDAWVDVFNDYSDFLGSVAGGNTDDKVNRRDNIYNDYYNENKAADRYLGDPAALRASVGLSDAFSVYDSAGSTITTESLQGAYEALRSGTSPAEALSAYYGFEVQPTTPEGSNYNNVEKYGTDAQRMAEFQSLVEPILQKSLPYIQATQGLSYTDALEYAYTHDPMLAALYQSYGVDLFRQTKDGSTYIYDPIAGQEIRTLEVKDASFKDVFPSLVKAGIIAAATGGIGGALGGALGMTAGQTSALTGALGSLAQGGDPKDAILAAVTGGVSGGLTDAVGSALGVSKEVATGITQAGLAAAQGAGSEEALLSGFLAGVGEYIRGESPANVAIDPNTGLPVDALSVNAVNPQGFVNTATTTAATDAVTTAIAQNPAASLSEIIVTAQRINPNIAADVLTNVAQQIASGAITPGGGMLTADTPAGDVEEVIVTPTDDVRYTMPTKDGAIIQTATELTATPFGQQFLTGVQSVDPAGHNEILKQIEAGADSITWRGRTILVSDLMGAPKTTTQAPERVPTEPTQPEGESLPDKPTGEDTEPQPDLPPEEDMEIPEFEIENLPPEFEAEIPKVVIPPETPVVPKPTTGGGGGSASGGVVVPPPATPPVTPPVTPPSTPPPAAPEVPVEEVVDVFDDGGLTGDAFGDSTVGGAEGGAAEVGGDAGDADVTTTEQYKTLQSELDNALASQGDLEVEVSNLQNEVAAANAAAQQAQEAAEAAEAAGAANADKLRGEAVAAQANADSLQGELNNVNAALGNANATIDSLQGRLTGTEAELGTALSTVENLTGELNTAQETVTNLSTKLNTAQSELSTLQSEYDKAVESNASNVKTLEGKIEAKESEITDLSSELSDATSTISELESSLADAQAATDAAIAEGIANAEAAEEAGFGEGFGEGYGEGRGLGLGAGIGLGLLSGQGSGSVVAPAEVTPFMQDLNTQLTRVQLSQPTQAKDYLAELLARLQA